MALRRKRARTAKDAFTKLTGIRCTPLIGGSECVVTKQMTASGMPIQKYAYIAYTGINKLGKFVEITSTCGVKNCVEKEHLYPIYKPDKEEIDYIESYARAYGVEDLAGKLDVPVDLLTEFIAKNNIAL